MKKDQQNNDLTLLDNRLDKIYGISETPSGEKYELEFEPFQIGELIQEERKRQNLTQAQLAKRAGTTKNQISRIENGESDIRLSMLMGIVREGLGGQVKLSIEF